MVEFKGQIRAIEPCFHGKGAVIKVYTEEPELSLIDAQKGDLRISICKWRELRSLNSNGYAWALLGELAKCLDTTSYELYEQYLQEQPKYYRDENGEYVVVTVPSKTPMSAISVTDENTKGKLHWKPYKQSSDGKFMSYIRILGSSHYDTSEMSHFLNLIIEDCKDQGIQTKTPKELEEMNARWGIG